MRDITWPVPLCKILVHIWISHPHIAYSLWHFYWAPMKNKGCLLVRAPVLNAKSCENFYQRVSIATYANRWCSQRSNACLSVSPSVCLSVTLRYCIKTKKASVMISPPPESLNILVSRNIWIIAKFERGHLERGRFMRLGWVKIGNFDDFSTHNPPYLRNGAR